MRKRLMYLIVSAALLSGSGMIAFGQVKSDTKQAGSDVKDAAKQTGKATSTAAKKTGKAVKKGSKKVVNKSASKTQQGASAVQKKTAPKSH